MRIRLLRRTQYFAPFLRLALASTTRRPSASSTALGANMSTTSESCDPSLTALSSLTPAAAMALLLRVARANPQIVAQCAAAIDATVAASSPPLQPSPEDATHGTGVSVQSTADSVAALAVHARKRRRDSDRAAVGGSGQPAVPLSLALQQAPPGTLVVPDSIVAVSGLPRLVTPPSARGFDMLRFRLRHVALHISYFGGAYAGFSSQDGPASLADGIPTDARRGTGGGPARRSGEGDGHVSLPRTATVETAVFAALQQACLIEGRADAWYTRCGRTDRGVSAAGQILALRLRSGALRRSLTTATTTPEAPLADEPRCATTSTTSAAPAGVVLTTWTRLSRDGLTVIDNGGDPFPAPCDEIDYAATLNALLPRDIRVLGWADVEHSDGASLAAAVSVEDTGPAGVVCHTNTEGASTTGQSTAVTTATYDGQAGHTNGAIATAAMSAPMASQLPHGPFSARFSATSRVYRYYFPGRHLDIEAMRDVSSMLRYC